MKDCFCPKDRSLLEKQTSKVGLLWHCPTCKGKSISVAVMKRTTDPKIVAQLWSLAYNGPITKKAPCVHCRNPMRTVSLPVENAGSLDLEVCTSCHFLWCEPAKLAIFPQPPPLPFPSKPRLEPIVRKREDKEIEITPLSLIQPDALVIADVAGHVLGGLFSLFTELG